MNADIPFSSYIPLKCAMLDTELLMRGIMLVHIVFFFGISKAQATETQFSDKNSSMFVKVFKDQEGYGAFLAHNHAIQAVGWSSEFKYEANL